MRSEGHAIFVADANPRDRHTARAAVENRFQFNDLHRAKDGETRECTYSDCLLPVDDVNIECAADSPNFTLPPGWTPYPSPAPTPFDTLAPIPTPAPALAEDGSEGVAIGTGDLNGAVGLISPVSVKGIGGAVAGAGVVALLVGWAAGRMAAVAGVR